MGTKGRLGGVRALRELTKELGKGLAHARQLRREKVEEVKRRWRARARASREEDGH